MKKFKFNNCFIQDEDYRKKFFPIRLILKSDNFDEIIKNETLDIWIFFYMNNSLKNVFNSKFVKAYGMSLSISYFQEVEITLNFIRDGCDDNQLFEVIEDTRISLQNFIFALLQGSFYAAFTEYRKCIEGILWLYVLLYEPKNIQDNRIDQIENYSQIFKKYCPELYVLWKQISNLIHQNGKRFYFNINSIYTNLNQNFLSKFFNLIKKTSLEFRTSVNLLFKLFDDSKYINRYEKILNFLDRSREIYKLKDVYDDENESEKTEFPLEIQNLLVKNFYKEKNLEEIIILYRGYTTGLFNALLDFQVWDQQSREDDEYIFKKFNIEKLFNNTYLTYFWNNTLLKNCDILSNEKITRLIYLFYSSRDNIFLLDEYKILILIPLIFYCSMLFIEEIYSSNKNGNIAILKSYLEDSIFTISIGKIELYGFYNSLFSFIHKKFEIDTETITKKISENLKNRKHVSPFNRTMYKNLYENKTKSTTGNDSQISKLMDVLFNILEAISLKSLNKNFKDRENIFYKEFLQILNSFSKQLKKIIYSSHRYSKF